MTKDLAYRKKFELTLMKLIEEIDEISEEMVKGDNTRSKDYYELIRAVETIKEHILRKEANV